MKAVLRLLTLSLAMFIAALPGQVRAPKAGVVRYRTGDVHPVFGLGSSYFVGPSYRGSAVAAAFSDRFGLVADGTFLTLAGDNLSQLARIPCVEAKPVLGIGDAADSAIAFLPSENVLQSFDGKSFVRVPVLGLEPGVTVTFVSKLDTASVRLLAARNDRTVFEAVASIETGQVSDYKAIDAHGTAAAQFGYYLSVYDGKLHLAPIDSSSIPQEFAFGYGPVTFEQSSSKSLHIASDGGEHDWIIYKSQGHVTVAELPIPAVSK